MTDPEETPQGVEPISEVQPVILPAQPRLMQTGIEVNIRGRRVRLRALHAPPKGILRWLAVLGPGLVAGAVSNDAGSIAIYSQSGALYGYDLLWVVLLITVSLMVVQEMSARLGAATGRGLLGLIRSRFGIGWAMFATIIVFIANFGLILGEFVGISSGMEILGISKYLSVGVAVLLVSYLVLVGSYNKVEKVFMLMAAAFLTYLVAAALAHPSLSAIVQGAFVPTIRTDPQYIALVVGLIGTTISPYQQVFQQSAVVEKGVSRRRYGPERWDTYAGMIFSSIVTIFIIVATAATLHQSGNTNVNSAADAANALKPIAGNAAGILFAIGIVGASMMAASIIPISTSFAFTDAFGLQEGMGLELRRAPVFYGLFLFQVIFAAGLSLIPNVPAFQLLVGVQILNGILFPMILVFMLILANDRRWMGDLKNSRFYNILGWGTLVLVSLAVVMGLLQQILSLFGLRLFGG